MRIAFVSDSVYPWNFGGLETLERAEADALAKEHELHFFSFRWPGMKGEFTKDRIHYHTFHDIDRSKFYRHNRRSIREAIAFAIGMVKIFGYRFDVVHSNEFPIIQLPVLKAYCILTGCKLIVDAHEVWSREYWTTYLGGTKGHLACIYANWALKMADHYIANSTATAEGLERLGIEKGKVTVFAPTLDDAKIASIEATKRSREILYVGRLIKEKRLDKWLGVVAKTMKLTKVKGVIVGDGPERNKIRSLIKKMGLERKVELHGFYSGAKKPALFKRIKEASLFLHMSEREGLSTVALESIALGTPVLLPSYTPIPDDVKQMCIVAEERELPKVAAGIINGKKEDHIPNRERVGRFYTSNTLKVYEGVFRKLGLERGGK